MENFSMLTLWDLRNKLISKFPSYPTWNSDFVPTCIQLQHSWPVNVTPEHIGSHLDSAQVPGHTVPMCATAQVSRTAPPVCFALVKSSLYPRTSCLHTRALIWCPHCCSRLCSQPMRKLTCPSPSARTETSVRQRQNHGEWERKGGQKQR